MNIVYLVLGLMALIIGAQLVVRFGSALARRLNMSPIIIGLTIVSIGTSLPEFAVSVQGMVIGSGDLVLGNIVGTNIVNLLLILGLAGLIRPIDIHHGTLKLDLPAMVVASLLLWVVAMWDGDLTTIEGAILLAFGIAYIWRVIATARSRNVLVNGAEPEHEFDNKPLHPGKKYALLDVGLLLIGLVIIVVGAEFMVDGAVGLAKNLGLSETLIGLTVVAIGTSAPELATTIMSTIRGERSIAIGNLIGSSTLNLTIILGGALMFGPFSIPIDHSLIFFDLPIMVGVAVACVPIFILGKNVNRIEGALMVGAYLAYLTFLIVKATTG
ncbi:MAG: calcium/sodium antiporter [Propionibacteriaceae bacterium]|nr:calcium/sodium antiporter [Propionibacteriaceae bacterium]